MKALHNRGFSMIELVMVIVILGVLAAVALPKFIDLSEEAEKTVVESFVGALGTAATMAYLKFILCGHYLGQAGQLHLGSFVRIDNQPAQPLGDCPSVLPGHAMDMVSIRASLLNDPQSNVMVDSPSSGDHMQLVTKSGHTIDILFDPSNRSISWTASPAY
jgi:prepilin-type N-terminal cleavage/methylation domain-containing protein